MPGENPKKGETRFLFGRGAFVWVGGRGLPVQHVTYATYAAAMCLWKGTGSDPDTGGYHEPSPGRMKREVYRENQQRGQGN